METAGWGVFFLCVCKSYSLFAVKQCWLLFAVGELDNGSETDIFVHIIKLVSEKSGVLN